MKKLIFIIAICSFNLWVAAQHPPHCGSDEYTEILINQNPEIAIKYAEAETAIAHAIAANEISKKNTQSVVYTIPVVFHVIYNSPADNISRNQIEDGLRVLNEDFRRLNADKVNTRALFLAVAADMEIEFKLAKKAPDGSCTDGINRIQSPLSVQANDAVKNLVHWDNSKYMNVWVVSSINSSSSAGITLGYAYRPFFGQTYDKDGILIRHDRVGTIGTGVSAGRTLTHETGHYLGLKHPFTDGCTQGDDISDTPPVASANFGCNLNANSCHNDFPDRPDMIENYMDYSDDICQNVFTQGQKSYMRSVLQTAGLRKELHQTANLNFTGVINPPACPPTALFAAEQSFMCSGDSIIYVDMTEDGDPISWNWSFPGGIPSTSTDINPVVYYQWGGTYDVSLTVSNSAGTSTLTKQDYMIVKESWNNHMPQWTETFEVPSLNTQDISIHSDLDTVQFELTNLAAKGGAQSLMLDNFNAQEPGDIDAVISPNLFTKFGKNLILSFDYAFAHRANSNTDLLIISASADCGQTWSNRRILAGPILRTVDDPVTDPFIPVATEWESAAVGFDIYQTFGPILIKFSFENGGGNNLFIDNINFTADNIGLEEDDFTRGLSIYPNPAQTEVNISFGNMLSRDVNIIIYDVYGKAIRKEVAKKDRNFIAIDDLNLAAGVYLISITDDKITHTEKLLVE